MGNKYKYLLQLFLLLIIILLVTFLLIPFAQKSVNSHTGGNDFFSIIFNIIALFFIAKLIYQIFKKKEFYGSYYNTFICDNIYNSRIEIL